MTELYVPQPEDADPDAEALMHQGKEDEHPENALYDPWFGDAEKAQAWTFAQHNGGSD